ncbi:MAG: MinD/ParA family protein [Alphaproteobacteria bacterium]
MTLADPSTPRERADNTQGAIPAQRNVYAIASGKGGVGKTWLSITLAQALAKKGLRVLLVDADLGLANVDIQLGLMMERTLNKVLAGKTTLRQAATFFETGEFHIIAGLSGSTSLANLPPVRLRTLARDLALLSQDYDIVLLDLGAGVDRTVQMLSQAARTCLVVTTDEPTALTDAYAFIKLGQAQHPLLETRIVVNMAKSVQEGQATYRTILRACEGFLKLSPPLAGIVRRDSHVTDSIRKQAPLITRFPTCAAATDVIGIADMVETGLRRHE